MPDRVRHRYAYRSPMRSRMASMLPMISTDCESGMRGSSPPPAAMSRSIPAGDLFKEIWELADRLLK